MITSWASSLGKVNHKKHYNFLYIILSCVTVKVPTSTNALVELMNMVERWRQRTDYGPVVVVSQDGISR
jgi:hypothetical protein